MHFPHTFYLVTISMMFSLVFSTIYIHYMSPKTKPLGMQTKPLGIQSGIFGACPKPR